MKKGEKKEKKLQKKKGGFRFTLTVRIACLALIPLCVMAIVLTAVGVNAIRSGMQDEIMDQLKNMTTTMDAMCTALDSGDFSLDSSNNLIKGSYNLTENESTLEGIVKDSDVDITFFFDKVRRATTLVDANTNEKILGTEAADQVYQTVVKGGQTLKSYDLVINNQPYYAYYAPMKNSDGKIVGMYFAGMPATDMNAFIQHKTTILVGAVLVIAIIALLVVLFSINKIRNSLHRTNGVVVGLGEGNLRVEKDESILNRGDELGDMARQVDKLQGELLKTITKVKESSRILLDSGKDLSTMAAQTSSTADEIGHAVEDISKGAVSQAEDIETASSRIEEMGDSISKIVNGVSVLDETSKTMKVAGDRSADIINQLNDSNDKTMDAIHRIGQQVNATNESANKISEAVELITSIAEETNLLSLNASIEAARAGEQGKGFAVVANQIQKLAEQSNESAQKIADIIQNLLQDSEKTVAVMSEVRTIVDEQQAKLNDTKEQFKSVSQGIDESRLETQRIKEETQKCDEHRAKVVDVITNLSAISEENAASTEETTASMEELNATINPLAESAGNLTTLSNDLDNEIKFFQL